MTLLAPVEVLAPQSLVSSEILIPKFKKARLLKQSKSSRQRMPKKPLNDSKMIFSINSERTRGLIYFHLIH